MKALPIDVYRRKGVDCTNDGISSKYDTLLLACDEGFLDVDESDPPENLVKINKRFLGGAYVYRVVPYNKPTGAGWMFGGNFAYTSDSRFHRMLGDVYGAIAIHDRQE